MREGKAYMNIKKRLITGMATAAIGLGLIGGGTYAYFNDTEVTNNTFANGMMDLGINKESIIHVKDLVPGDTIHGDFKLTNDGTVDMKEVVLHTDYEVIDHNNNNNGDDLGNHIEVRFINKVSGKEAVVYHKTLAELKKNPAQVLKEFPADSKDEPFTVRLAFKDNKENQNHFQGDELKLKWEFEAVQRDGKLNFSN
jgi:spore coat-associated protein N